MYARRTKAAKSHGRLLWGSRVLVQEPIVSDGLATCWYQIPYEGEVSRNLIRRALKKSAGRSYFGRVYEPVVTKIDPLEEVAVVKITFSV